MYYRCIRTMNIEIFVDCKKEKVNIKYQGNMMQEIFEFSQPVPAVVDFTKVFMFCKEFC